MAIFRIFPLLVLPLAYFAMVSTGSDGWTTEAYMIFNMYSGATWTITNGEVFVLVCLVLLFVEIVKSVNTRSSEIINHGLSMLVAMGCAILFATQPNYANSAFFLLTAMAIVDVIAGFAISIVTARRDFGTN